MMNRAEVEKAYEKLARRKGKLVATADLHLGDLVRRVDAPPGVEALQRVTRTFDGVLMLEWAHESLYTRLFSFYGGRPFDTFEENAFCRVATQNEYPLPIHETDLNTLVSFNPDGTVCCLNIIHGREGQHVTISREEYDLKKEVEKSVRNWLEEDDPCERCFGRHLTVRADRLSKKTQGNPGISRGP